ncbi:MULTISPECIES: nuclease-related domain-containing DEAD/DEAH box helicase [unclassified Empedobacter]|uniref:nuclease-related domain-containing DEAD/DEAH box helicase n=1 Tax=unclassified Empedobacter TaxID=2643773 RepID=UPI0025BE3298|nr:MULTISPECIES: NERD domain-containing protein [unclassified Empedobacter]
MAIFYPTLDEIKNFRVKPEFGELHILNFLNEFLDDTFEIFFNPFLNGDRPDIIIMKKGQGVLIIEVKDYNLDLYKLDEKKNWVVKSINQKIKSPISQVLQYKENLFNLHIEKLLQLKISDIKNFNTVKCAVYFHNATNRSISDLLIKPFEHDRKYLDFLKYNVSLIGKDDLNPESFTRILKECYLISKNPSYYFTDEMYTSIKRFLNPPFHFKEQVKGEIIYSEKQKEIIYAGSVKKEQRIKGVVGSGKTTILAARAVQAVKRNNDNILILTFNITLKNYIKDKISLVREDFDWRNFYISNYHLFIKTELNNIGISIMVPDGFDKYTEEQKEIYFEQNYYSNVKLFEENKSKLKTYKAIFIDEIQDYKRPWMDILKNFFLEKDGEYVLFGDVKQNIYNNKTENKDIVTNVRGVIELKKSYRSDFKIQDLTIDFQNEFFKDKYEIDFKKEFSKTNSDIEFDFEKQGSIKYMFLEDVDNLIALNTIIHQNSVLRNIQPNDITILSNTINLLREFDRFYRYSTNEKTNTMFETWELIYRIGINKLKNEKWILDFYKLLKRDNDYNSTKANNQISVLFTLYDLYLKYPEIFEDKLILWSKKFNTSKQELISFFNKFSEEISLFRESIHTSKISKNLKAIRDNKKINFYLNSGTVKMSTIHSFKGWECKNIFLIIENLDIENFEELIYTGITRCKENLFIINFGNKDFHRKIKTIII